MAFVTAAELASHLGVEFTSEETTRAEAILAGVEAAVQGYTHQTIELVEDDEITLDGNGTDFLLLPEFPVTACEVSDDGEALVEGEDEDFVFYRSGIVRRQGGAVWPAERGVLTVTYTHGYDPVPEDVKLIVKAAAARAFGNPDGLASEAKGAYQVNYGPLDLLRTWELAVLDRYGATR